MHNRKVWVYDIETFGNVFSCIYYNVDTLERRDFVVCKWKDELDEFVKFTTSDEIKGMVGFNNIGFDYPVIHRILVKPHLFKDKSGEEKARIIKGFANKVIAAEYSNISDKNTRIPQLDLYKINHFDNIAKRCGLKWCEFALRWNNIQDLPFEHDHELTEEEVEGMMEYNFNDVLATYQLYLDCQGKIELRKKISKSYNLKLLNANDPEIGSEIFAKIICKKRGITWNQLRNQRTHRDEIKLSECIFDYVKFESKKFNKLLTFLKNKVITETKGVFDNLTVNHKGLEYVYGTGGLHAACKPGVYEVDDEYELWDWDVASYYPNLAIKNKIYPEHLGEVFCEIYEEIYNTRKDAKKSGDKITDAGLKLALNGTYGKSNSRYSYLYDPKFTMSITINGQLLLTMLAEKFANISTVLQANTDGIVIRIHKSKLKEMHEIVKWWEELTKLELEDSHYSKLVSRDVNNYMAIYTNGKVKYKGAFQIDKEMKGELQYHKDHSKRIVSIAVSLYFTDGIPVKDTILNHFNCGDYYNGKIKNHGIFDYCLAKKTIGGLKGKPKMIIRGLNGGKIFEKQLQKTNRYYVSNKGFHFIKKYNNGSESQIEAHPQSGRGYKVTVFNKYEKQEKYNVDFTYYIREADKLINSIITLNYSLF